MNCENAIELLPWYLNGTLDEQEQRGVREHLAGCERCRQALAETRLAWRIYDQHLPTEALVALAWEERPEGLDSAAVETHLQSCPQCSAELELVRMSRALERALEEDDGGRVALFPGARRTAETAARPARSTGGWRSAALAAGLAGMVAAGGWLWSANQVQTLEDRLAAAETSETVETRPAVPAPVTPAPAPPVAGSIDRERVAEMEAEMEQLRQQEERMREQLDRIAAAAPVPQINTRIVGLQPTGDVVRGGAGEAEEVPAGGYASLMLTASHRETHQDHRIEVVDESGKVVWSADGLRRTPEGDFAVTLPPGALKPGAYTMRVSAQEDGKRVDLESYGIRVR